ncbi:MAG: hypothetical protein ABR581_04780 [Thermoleophilaceae bacterium]
MDVAYALSLRDSRLAMTVLLDDYEEAKGKWERAQLLGEAKAP